MRGVVSKIVFCYGYQEAPPDSCLVCLGLFLRWHLFHKKKTISSWTSSTTHFLKSQWRVCKWKLHFYTHRKRKKNKKNKTSPAETEKILSVQLPFWDLIISAQNCRYQCFRDREQTRQLFPEVLLLPLQQSLGLQTCQGQGTCNKGIYFQLECTENLAV